VLAATLFYRLDHDRRILLTVLAGVVVLLVPWTVYLAHTLPDRYDTGRWRAVWVGFDVALLLCFAAGAWLGLRRRRAAVPLLSATAALLCYDEWFDVVLGWTSSERWTNVALAVLVEGMSLCPEVSTRDITPPVPASRRRGSLSRGVHEGPLPCARRKEGGLHVPHGRPRRTGAADKPPSTTPVRGYAKCSKSGDEVRPDIPRGGSWARRTPVAIGPREALAPGHVCLTPQ